MWALEPDCPGQSLLVEDCGLLEDGALGLLTAAISQPGNFPHVTDGETEAQRGQLAFWRPQSRSMAAKELLHHGSLGSAPPPFLLLPVVKLPRRPLPLPRDNVPITRLPHRFQERLVLQREAVI